MSNELSLSLIAGINLKRLIRSSRYRTQENFAYEFGAEIRTVSRWLNAGVKNIDTLEEIADFLEEDVLTIQRIYDIANTYAPEYDIEKIVQKLENTSGMKQK